MEKELEILKASLEARDVEIKKLMATATDQITALGQANADLLKTLNAQVEAGTAQQARILELEQKMAASYSNGGHGLGVAVSLSQMAAESDEFKSVMEGRAISSRLELPRATWHDGAYAASTISSGTTGAGNGGVMLVADRIPGIVAQPDRQLTIRDLLMPGQTSGQTIEYVRETGFTNAANFVTEGKLKPQSDLQFELKTANVRTIAHWVKATRQILADVPQLRSYIDGRLRYGLRFKEEDAFMRGTGTGQQIEGIKTVATDYETSRNLTGDTRIDTIRHALTQVQIAEYNATGIILHPNDWEKIELTKTTEGAYLFANPQGLASPTLWGRPVVSTQAQTEGEFTVGAFRMASQIFDREDITVELATQHADDFTSNLVTILAEERTTLVHFRPEAIVDGAFPQA